MPRTMKASPMAAIAATANKAIRAGPMVGARGSAQAGDGRMRRGPQAQAIRSTGVLPARSVCAAPG